MSTAWQEFDARIAAWLDASPSRIPLITGGCGTGRSRMLGRVAARLGADACRVVDVSRITTTPERFLRALTDASPLISDAPAGAAEGTAAAFERALAFLTGARTPEGPATFLLDEILDLRSFESFPGLKQVVLDSFARLVASPNRFVLTTRFTSRALRVARGLPERILVHPVPALNAIDVAGELQRVQGLSPGTVEEFAQMLVALTDGRYGYVLALVDHLACDAASAGDPITALAQQLSPDGVVAQRCAFSYELRLNRTRGYGTLRAILAILADVEPLTLTEIAQQLQRTPGSAKDYLSWLEEVDLVASHRRRYAFTDPVLRLWVKLNAGPLPPSEAEIIAQVQRYAIGRLSRSPGPTPAEGQISRPA